MSRPVEIQETGPHRNRTSKQKSSRQKAVQHKKSCNKFQKQDSYKMKFRNNHTHTQKKLAAKKLAAKQLRKKRNPQNRLKESKS